MKTHEELMADWIELVNRQLEQQQKFNESIMIRLNEIAHGGSGDGQ